MKRGAVLQIFKLNKMTVMYTKTLNKLTSTRIISICIYLIEWLKKILSTFCHASGQNFDGG